MVDSRHPAFFFIEINSDLDFDNPDLSVIYNPIRWCYDPKTIFLLNAEQGGA